MEELNETDKERKIRQIKELGEKVYDIAVSHSCNDGYDEEEAKKEYDNVCWMLQTKPYRESNLGWIQLMEHVLSEILYPDTYKD